MAIIGIQIISLVTAILGAVLGSAGLAISILAYLRDRAQIHVHLGWDLEELTPRTGRKIGVVSVTNTGRRAIHIGAVGLSLPKHHDRSSLLLLDSIGGRRLGEGDPPAKFMVNYGGMEKYKTDWKRIRAFAEDGSGKRYYSKHSDKKPSWAQ